ncbi:MAG: protein kinase domain-containing protein [Planctomycetota bacterium]
MYILTVTRGPDQGKRFRLTDGRIYKLGSGSDASFPLTDPKILDPHCSIQVGGGQVILVNHTASAGTFIGDKKLAKARLQPNMSFRIGDTVLTLSPEPAQKGQPAAKPQPARQAAAEPDPMVGKILGGYKVNEVVGRGGMGTVYKSTQLSLHREVALKVLRPRLARDKAFVDLFINEARSAAQLVHPNVVQVYDAGREGDSPYFSMEFMGEGSVEELLESDGKIPWEQAILMVLESAHGLAFAEGKGIVHRDIKPDNLMLNEDGQVKIADLGLAKRGQSAKEEGITGTPHFIPPEQALGKDVDTRADIYSLGATFFRMITGKTLYTGKTAKEIVLKHIKEAPPAASSHEPDIPDELDLVIAKMLAKDPDQRYQTAPDLISALEEVCAHYGIKGAIIKRGVGKRVLIPILALLLVALAVVTYLIAKPKDVIQLEDLKSREAARLAEAARRREADKRREADRQRSKADAQNAFDKLKIADLTLKGKVELSNVYTSEDPKERSQREKQWIGMAEKFEDFSKTEDATAFGHAGAAMKRAEIIRSDLDRYKKSAKDQREKIDLKINEAKKIDEEQQLLIGEWQSERRYEDAYNLCGILAREETAPGDPFHPIVSWIWVSPVDESLTMAATANPDIKAVITNARKAFAKQQNRIPTLAKRDWDKVKKNLPNLDAEPPDAEIEKAIAALKEVETKFASVAGRPVREIRVFIHEAKRRREAYETALAKGRLEDLNDDRTLVRNTRRKSRSLDPDVIPNLVMNLEIAQAIDWWSKHKDQLKTEKYKRFVDERIEMLRWIDYLFARFQKDLKDSLANKSAAPLATLDLDMLDPDVPSKPVETNFTRPNGDVYEIAFAKKIKGNRTWKLGRMPMDWVYHNVLCHQSKPRWKEIPAAVRFALGAFCNETMLCKEAVQHFEELTGDERYGEAARSLIQRAKREMAACKAYEALLAETQEAANRRSSAYVVEIRAKLRSFHKEHEGTLFYLDVMHRNDEVRKDFFDEKTVPTTPEAPQRP